jgi:hypothetical protein
VPRFVTLTLGPLAMKTTAHVVNVGRGFQALGAAQVTHSF